MSDSLGQKSFIGVLNHENIPLLSDKIVSFIGVLNRCTCNHGKMQSNMHNYNFIIPLDK